MTKAFAGAEPGKPLAFMVMRDGEPESIALPRAPCAEPRNSTLGTYVHPTRLRLRAICSHIVTSSQAAPRS